MTGTEDKSNYIFGAVLIFWDGIAALCTSSGIFCISMIVSSCLPLLDIFVLSCFIVPVVSFLMGQEV